MLYAALCGPVSLHHSHRKQFGLFLAWSTAQGIFHLEYLGSGAVNKSSHAYLPFELESANPRTPRSGFW